MGLEVALVLQVGSGSAAEKAKIQVTVTDSVANGNTFTVTVPDEDPVVLVKGTAFNGGSGNDALAEELRVAVAAIDGVTATRANNVVTIEADEAGEAGNEITVATNNQSAFAFTGGANGSLAGGVEANLPVPMRLELDEDGLVHMSIDGEEVFNIKFSETEFENTKTFQQEIQQWLKKVQK